MRPATRQRQRRRRCGHLRGASCSACRGRGELVGWGKRVRWIRRVAVSAANPTSSPIRSRLLPAQTRNGRRTAAVCLLVFRDGWRHGGVRCAYRHPTAGGAGLPDGRRRASSACCGYAWVSSLVGARWHVCVQRQSRGPFALLAGGAFRRAPRVTCVVRGRHPFERRRAGSSPPSRSCKRQDSACLGDASSATCGMPRIATAGLSPPYKNGFFLGVCRGILPCCRPAVAPCSARQDQGELRCRP
jgi:hypothetical protein